MPSSRQEILATLEEANLPEIVDRLVRFTLSRLKRVGLGSSRGPIPGGSEPKDFVQEAVRKALAGERAWKNPQTVSLLHFLMGIIRSDISHLVTRLETRTMVRATQLTEEDKANRPAKVKNPKVVDISELIDRRPDLQDSSIKVWEDVLECVGDDSVLRQIVQIWRDDGVVKAKDIAEKLGISVNDVNNAIRRGKRKITQWKGQEGISNRVSRGGMKSD